MLNLIFGIWASESPPGPGERLKRPGLIGLKKKIKSALDNGRVESGAANMSPHP